MTQQITPRAAADLEQIEAYIAQYNAAAALAFVQQLRHNFRLLAKNPGIGSSRKNLSPGLRSLAEGNYVIFYRPGGGSTEIVRVLHAARKIRRSFFK